MVHPCDPMEKNRVGSVPSTCSHCGSARDDVACVNPCCPNGRFGGRPLHDVSEWPDGRLLELAEARASYDAWDVASMAHALLDARRRDRAARKDDTNEKESVHGRASR